ncbi:MAG: histidine--tRNA ligase [Rhizobiales bacterium PAR1]|nr:MAG: histidine--tRNA ligase [Rhizobiales bacterium PAR1]
MSTENKTSKTEARKPRGLQDRGPADIAATEAMMKTIREVYSRYGFDAVETPFLEYTDALGKFLPDQDRPNAGVFSLRDDDDQWMSLRYDLTAPLARYCAENWQNLPKPYRSYRAGWVFRNEKPGPGRFRQFMQFDADTVGAASVAADAEICMMAADTLEALGVPRGQYVIKVNNRKVLDGVMEAIGLGGPEHSGTRLTVLRAIDKLDKFGFEGVRLLLGKGRRDESGDFTKGAELSELQIAEVMVLFETPAMAEEALAIQRVPSAKHGAGLEDIREYENRRLNGIMGGVMRTAQKTSLGLDGASELRSMWGFLSAAGYNDGRIRIDPSVVRGLEYYTGPVYEAELLFEVKDEDGKPVRFGSVGGGGRYDGLVSRFLNEPVPATGFSIGVSRLLAALQLLGKVSTTPEPGPVLVLAMDRDAQGMASYQKVVADLRNAGIRSEIYLGASGMKAQMKYADRRASPVAIIQGSNEREKGTVQIKDLILGATLVNEKDRETYLAKQAEAQFEVPVSEVVEAVRKVLARHA